MGLVLAKRRRYSFTYSKIQIDNNNCENMIDSICYMLQKCLKATWHFFKYQYPNIQWWLIHIFWLYLTKYNILGKNMSDNKKKLLFWYFMLMLLIIQVCAIFFMVLCKYNFELSLKLFGILSLFFVNLSNNKILFVGLWIDVTLMLRLKYWSNTPAY